MWSFHDYNKTSLSKLKRATDRKSTRRIMRQNSSPCHAEDQISHPLRPKRQEVAKYEHFPKSTEVFLHRPSPTLLHRTRHTTPILPTTNRPIIPNPNLPPRHKHLPRLLSLLFQILPYHIATLFPDKSHQRNADQQRETE